MLVCARVPHGGRGGHNWHSYLCVPAGSLSSRQSESWQRERQAFPIPHPSLFFFSLRGLWREEGEICVCVCVCVLVIVCVCACVFWISVLLHNKSLLNKCKADGTVVSPPWGEKEREKEREKRRKKEEQGKKNLHAYSLFSSSTDTLIMHITQTVTVSSCKTLNPGVEAKGGVWIADGHPNTFCSWERTFCLSKGTVKRACWY